MKSAFSLKEVHRHRNPEYTFQQYNIISDDIRRFATNHWHDETEIVHIISGGIDININGETFVGNPGDIFIINSGEMHEIYGTRTPLDYCAFVFDFDMLSFDKEDFVQKNFIAPIMNGELQFCNHINFSETAGLLLNYIKEINISKPDCYTLSTKALLMQFFALMIEQQQFSASQDPDINNEKKQFLKQIIEYIDGHYTEEITLTEIAGHFNMSAKYFCRFFKAHFRKTFVEYLNDVRIEIALRLLAAPNASVTKTAIACGFSNMSYFTRIFKSKIGCTPSQYKKYLTSKEKDNKQISDKI